MSGLPEAVCVQVLFIGQASQPEAWQHAQNHVPGTIFPPGAQAQIWDDLVAHIQRRTRIRRQALAWCLRELSVPPPPAVIGYLADVAGRRRSWLEHKPVSEAAARLKAAILADVLLLMREEGLSYNQAKIEVAARRGKSEQYVDRIAKVLKP